jgi:hypothetical protein
LEDIRDTDFLTRSTPAALYHCRGFWKNTSVMQVNFVKDGAYVRSDYYYDLNENDKLKKKQKLVAEQ